MMGLGPEGPVMHVVDHLTPDRLRALADAAPGRRRFLRIRAVLLAAEGRTAPEVAAALGCSRRAAQAWVARYNDEGAAAFDERPRTGRPPFLDVEAAARLRARLDAGPADGDAACTLRGPEIREVLRREFGVRYSPSAVYALLHRLGYSCLDPRPRHRKADPAAAEEFKKKSPDASTTSPASTPVGGSRSGSRTRRGSARRGR
jgi:transposase